MTTLIFVRHGQSVANLLRVFAGQTDFELTDLGKLQAEKGAAFLKKNFAIDAIYSSDLKRATQTAEPTSKAFGLDIVPLEGLRERCIGVWEGKTNREVNEQYHDLYQARLRREPVYPEGAERPEDIMQRTRNAEKHILSESKGKTVAVFTHAGVLSTLSVDWKKTLPDLGDVDVYGNSSITALEYDDEGIARRIVLKNYLEHLGEDASVVPPALI